MAEAIAAAEADRVTWRGVLVWSLFICAGLVLFTGIAMVGAL